MVVGSGTVSSGRPFPHLPSFVSFLYFYALLLSSALISKTVFSIEQNVFISIRGYGNVPQKVLNLSLCRSQPPVGQSGLHTSGVGGAANTRPCPSPLLGDVVGTFRRADFTASSCILGLFSGICKGRLGKGAPGPGSACGRVLRVSSLHSVLRDAPLTCRRSFTLKVSADAPRQGPNPPHSADGGPALLPAAEGCPLLSRSRGPAGAGCSPGDTFPSREVAFEWRNGAWLSLRLLPGLPPSAWTVGS